MRVDPQDGVCRACGGILEITDADDATMTVECRCGESYLVQPDAFGDGAVHYWPQSSSNSRSAPVSPNDNDPAHDLMPEALLSTIPPLYATEHEQDSLARLKWFTPDGNWSWFVVEFSPQQRLCFGLVIGHERELGYFSLDEVLSVRGPLGLPVERDLYFNPTPISKCQ